MNSDRGLARRSDPTPYCSLGTSPTRSGLSGEHRAKTWRGKERKKKKKERKEGERSARAL